MNSADCVSCMMVFFSREDHHTGDAVSFYWYVAAATRGAGEVSSEQDVHGGHRSRAGDASNRAVVVRKNYARERNEAVPVFILFVVL